MGDFYDEPYDLAFAGMRRRDGKMTPEEKAAANLAQFKRRDWTMAMYYRRCPMPVKLTTVSNALVVMAASMDYPKGDTVPVAKWWLKLLETEDATDADFERAVIEWARNHPEMPSPHGIIDLIRRYKLAAKGIIPGESEWDRLERLKAERRALDERTD